MTRAIIIAVSLIVANSILAACSSNSVPAASAESAYSAEASEIALGTSLTPYVSANEPVWPSGSIAPDSVPTPPGISEEVEDDDEDAEEEDDPAVENCHTTADACFAAEKEEVECLSALGNPESSIGGCCRSST